MHEPENPSNEIDCSTVERTVNAFGLARRFPAVRVVIDRMQFLHSKGISLEVVTHDLAKVLHRQHGIGRQEAYCVAHDAALAFAEGKADMEGLGRS